MEAETIRDSLCWLFLISSVVTYFRPAGRQQCQSPQHLLARDPQLTRSVSPRLSIFLNRFSTTGRRDVTNVPAQSLTMMNDPMIMRSANSLVASLLADSQLESDQQRIEQAFVVGLSRLPNAAETERCQALPGQDGASDAKCSPAGSNARTTVCQTSGIQELHRS